MIVFGWYKTVADKVVVLPRVRRKLMMVYLLELQTIHPFSHSRRRPLLGVSIDS